MLVYGRWMLPLDTAIVLIRTVLLPTDAMPTLSDGIPAALYDAAARIIDVVLVLAYKFSVFLV